MSMFHRLLLAGTILPGLPLAPAQAQNATDAFALGTIYVSTDNQSQGGTTEIVSGDEAARTGRASLEDTVSTLPGVTSVSNSGGSRNEAQVFVRGFDRWRVPLSIDGIRIYLPADNRLDYGRFLTPDLAQVEVQKGYVSVINGPGGMGGAINLVTRKPTEAFEGVARLGVEAGNRGDVTGRSGYLSLGTKQDLFYAQASYMRREVDDFYLSRDYKPDPAYPYQGKGKRNNANRDDTRLNLKFGYTPNETDEYVLSYTRQTGQKEAPYSTALPVRGVTGTGPGNNQRDWTWPEWDISSLAFYSHTELKTGYVKTKLYYNTFDNTLSSWDDVTHSAQTVGRAFDSVYDDYALGGSVEYGTSVGAHDLRFATHFRRDVHRETNYPRPTLGWAPDPRESNKEETWSVAVEDTWTLSDDWRLIGGLSYDKSRVLHAERVNGVSGQPGISTDALNWQLAAIWTPEMGGRYHASVSSRTSFPTLFHRYSRRFGSADPNPNLDAERALNYELGYSRDWGDVQIETTVFYNKVEDMIRSVFLRYDGTNEIRQNQNVGDGTYKGLEFAANWAIHPSLGLHANYTFMDTSVRARSINGLRITDIPRHKAYVRLDWQATPTLQVSPSLELYSKRWSNPAIGSGDAANPAYTRMGGYALANLDMNWNVTEAASVNFGIRNLFDRDIEVVEGFPEPGRSFYLMSELRF